MNILARQLTIDMYSCKPDKLADTEALMHNLKTALADNDYTPLDGEHRIFHNNHIAIFLPLAEGHLSVDVYEELRYAALDLFVCKANNLPEKAIKDLRRTLKPDTVKMTYLRRGDFGTVTDMKPHIKTKMTQWRRLQNTGVKVMHLLPKPKFLRKFRRNK